MQYHFYKYQGTGNDFIIFDNRNGEYSDLSALQVSLLCNRKFGIGADGLMLLNNAPGIDFEMKYFNADGHEGSMCGNGGRCLVKFAYHCGIHKNMYHFAAIDGEHLAEIDLDGTVSLKMRDVYEIKNSHNDFILNTGSPHLVKMVTELDKYDVYTQGKLIRNSAAFIKDGINVDFVQQITDDEIFVRTYERGVEDETLSCGTGVTAAALVCYHNENGFNDVTVFTKGGKLTVEYDRIDDSSYKNVWLSGPAEKVFEGTTELSLS